MSIVMLPAFSRYWHLLRHHRPSQFVNRGISRARQWMLRKSRGGRYAAPLSCRPTTRHFPQLAQIAERKLSNRRLQGGIQNAECVRANVFRFLNEELRLPEPVDWRLTNSPGVDPLWRFHLHYHEFLLDLLVEAADCGRADSFAHVARLVESWITANPLTDERTHGDAWHPFCISRRLPVWMVYWQVARLSDANSQNILESMYRQAKFLASHLERDLGGNHLLENARALVMAGCFFDGAEPDHWLSEAREIFRRELPEQILTEGEHFERAPMYHAHMLDVLLDVRDATMEFMPALSRPCGEAAGRMADFLEQILHPDGEIPLFGDSAFGEAPPATQLIAQVGHNRGSTPAAASDDTLARRVGDYWIWRDGGDCLIFDGGPVGADHLPAHAHSDLSNFELSLGGRRLIVDSGVFAYRDDELRRYCRSTEAHCVLQIDGREQCDTWSRFRMGYRGRPIEFQTGCANQFAWARFQHNAYRRVGVPRVGRWIAGRRGGPWLIVDWAEGCDTHSLTNRLHLHPEVQIEDVTPMTVTLRLVSQRVRIGALTDGKLEVRDGMYCPEFGRQIPAPVVCWENQLPLPAACGWWIDSGDSPGAAVLNGTPIDHMVLHWKNGPETQEWQPRDLFGSKSQNGRLVTEH